MQQNEIVDNQRFSAISNEASQITAEHSITIFDEASQVTESMWEGLPALLPRDSPNRLTDLQA